MPLRRLDSTFGDLARQAWCNQLCYYSVGRFMRINTVIVDSPCGIVRTLYVALGRDTVLDSGTAPCSTGHENGVTRKTNTKADF